MQRTSVLRVITAAAAAVVLMMFVGLIKVHESSSSTTTEPIPTGLSNNRQSQQHVAAPGLAHALGLLSNLSMEQSSKDAITLTENQEGEAPEGQIGKANAVESRNAEDAESHNSAPTINSRFASKHELTDMILNREIPGYSGGAGVLGSTRWKPGFDYHPHSNVHETLQFLHSFYDKLKALSNTTNDSTSAYFTPTVSNSRDSKNGDSLDRLESHLVTNKHNNQTKALYSKPPPPPATVAANSAESFPAYEDYSDQQLTQLIHCPNQTICLSPVLQLQRPYNVYFCKHIANGVRFYYLVREGLLLHPQIHLIEDMFAADVIVYLPESARWHRSECRDPRVRHKMVVLDEGDGPQMFVPPINEDAKFLVSLADDNNSKHPPSSTHKQFLLYFKRSYVRRGNGVFRGYMNYVTRNLDVLPMFYPVATAYLRHPVLPHTERDLEIVCSLRGSNWDPTRQRIKGGRRNMSARVAVPRTKYVLEKSIPSPARRFRRVISKPCIPRRSWSLRIRRIGRAISA
jgi:hypothetical protein